MRNSAFKSGIYLALTAAIVVCGANQAWTTPFRLDRLAFERIHQPTEQQASLDWMARLPDAPTKAVEEIRLVRLRPSARTFKGRVNSIDADILVATPGGRPISDAYDFAGVDPGGFAPITPVEIKRQRTPEPPESETPEPIRSNEVLDLSVRTLDYVVLTTKIFVENISRFLMTLL